MKKIIYLKYKINLFKLTKDPNSEKQEMSDI